MPGLAGSSITGAVCAPARHANNKRLTNTAARVQIDLTGSLQYDRRGSEVIEGGPPVPVADSEAIGFHSPAN